MICLQALPKRSIGIKRPVGFEHARQFAWYTGANLLEQFKQWTAPRPAAKFRGDMNSQKTDDPVFSKVCELLAPFNKDNVDLSDSTEITVDLEIDSVAVLDMIMDIEDTYDISIAMNQIAEIRTIGELVAAIHQLMGEK